jgi:hypothetical protein
MAETPDFKQFVPGFDFLQGLAKNATASLPAIGQWMTPTLDPDELERRIGELRTVQFWLEQNATLLGTTIQALEVQRMTLSTLKTMNVQMDDLREALQIRTPSAATSETPAAAPPQPESETGAAPAAALGSAMVDPMQWWGALTQQFSQLATAAMKDAPEAARGLAASMIQPSQAAANDTLQAKPGTAEKSAARAKAGQPGRTAASGTAATKGATTKRAATRKNPVPGKRPTR